MRRHEFRRLGGWRCCALLVATLVIMAGCGSIKPARGVPITDIDLIAGKWAGTMTPGPSGEQAFYLTIAPDRKLTAAWGPNTAWGTVTLQNGRATYSMEPGVYEGTITLYVDGDRRTLVMDDTFASFNAQVTPQR